MSGLTPEEEAEYAALLRQEDDAAGSAHVERVDSQRFKPKKAGSRPLSALYRVPVGGVRDAIQGIFDFVDDAGDALGRKTGIGGLVFGANASNGFVEYLGFNEFNKRGGDALFGTDRRDSNYKLPTLKGEEDAGGFERAARAITSYAIPFVGWSRAFGVMKAGSFLGRSGRGLAAGYATDLGMDPYDNNLANFLKEFGVDNDFLDSLTTEDDDDRLASRFKAAAVNAPVGLAADAIMELGVRGVKAYRAWRGTLEEADAAVKATQPIPVNRSLVVQTPQDGTMAATKAADAAGGSADDAAGSTFTREGRAEKRTTAEDAMWTKTDKDPESFEDILDFLKAKAGLGEMDEQMLSRFADNLVNGDPENALAKMGIDPAKLDYSLFDDPDMLGRLHRGLAEVYEGIAQRLGRSNTRVSTEATVMAARTMATSADALKDLYGSTANLAETMMASRMFVGSHAHKLIAEAQAAMAAVRAGGGEAEWLKFLETFQRHAYFLGALRGAGSEVARALRSLQMVAKVGKKTAYRTVADAKPVLDAQGSKGLAKQLALEAQDKASQMLTPYERLQFLGRIIDNGGDVGDLSRFTRAASGSKLKRLDAALGETRGNLFSAGTAVLNALSGSTMLGLNATAKLIASTARMAASPFGKQHAQAARVAALDAWAYMDGMIGGWRDGFRNMAAVLQREGYTELGILGDTYGSRHLAEWSQRKAQDAAANMKGANFERVDMSQTAERSFVLDPADRRHLNEVIESWNTPALMEHALKFVLRGVVTPTVNTAGALSRLGTILFINAPDQLIGTIAAKAGAQAHAVRLAAQEAAELQLEGKALADYLKARMVQLTDTVDGFADDSYSAGRQEVALAHGNEEARAALFQDDLETGFARGMMHMLTNKPFVHMIVPFVKTPLRILEKTAIDYTPLGFLKDRVRRDIMAGGAARDEALARIALGTMMVTTAFQLSEDRTIIGQDGDYKSSARLARPSYTLQVGDDLIEFSRLDPLGTLLGWGADVHAYLRDQEMADDPSGPVMQMIEAAIWATQANMLSKTWLTSLKNLTQLADASSGDEFNTRLKTYGNSFAARLMPASGIQRTVIKGEEGVAFEASNFIEATIKASVGADRLPVKRDPILGRPVPVESGERLVGMKVGPGASDLDDPLLAELDRLSFDMPAAKRTQEGVKLNSAEFSRWLELRGQVVRNEDTGLTLEETLSELIKLPEYQQLPRAARIEAMRTEMQGFSKLATAALVEENPEFAVKVLRQEVTDEQRLLGGTRADIDKQTEEFGRQLGLIK